MADTEHDAAPTDDPRPDGLRRADSLVIVNTGNADNNQNVEVTQGQGGRGQPVRLQAKPGAKYQLLDLEKAKAVGPNYVKVKRVGKNLHILFEGSTEADVIIEDYYDVMPEGYNGVVG